MMWLSLYAVVWFFLEPSRMKDEMLHDSRRRVAKALVRDPLFWAFAVLAVVCFCRWMNDGIQMAYDAENQFWYVKKAAMAYFPGSITGHGEIEFSALLAVWIIVMGIRHALGRAARLGFLFMSSLFAGVAVAVSGIAAVFGNSEAIAAMNTPYGSRGFAGLAFGLYFLGGVTGLAGALEHKWKKITMFFILGLGGSAAGAFLFAPPAMVALYAIAAAVFLLFNILWLAFRGRTSSSMKLLAVVIMSLGVAVLIVMAFSPEGLDAERVSAVLEGRFFPDTFSAIAASLAEISKKAWLLNPWLGSGIDSFPLDIRFNATDDDWALLPIGITSAYSGWWTFIAERGIVGALMMATPLGFMVWTFLHRLPGVLRHSFFMPGVALGFAAFAAAIAETFADASFLRPEALIALAAFMAVAAASLPPLKDGKKSGNQKDNEQDD